MVTRARSSWWWSPRPLRSRGDWPRDRLELLQTACSTHRTQHRINARHGVEEALEDADSRGGGWREPEIYRRRGELYLALPMPDREQAENAFLKALHRARLRKERALELRAVMSLVRLWRDDGERYPKAHSTLKTIFESYTEGFETTDLVEAKRLL